ncbi:MAG: hypothetical protein ABIJ82_01400 [Patescibacteria group bacterium]
MGTVVRLFLEENAELKVRETLAQLKVGTIGKKRSTNGSRVVNVFDPGGFRELIDRKFSKKEQAVLIASVEQDLNYFSNVHTSLKQKGVALLGILDLAQSDWKLLFKYLLE